MHKKCNMVADSTWMIEGFVIVISFLKLGKGDINVSIIEPGAVALWHRHMKQDDYQIVIKGSLKVGMCNAPYMDKNDLEHFRLPEDQITAVYTEREELLENWKRLRKEGGDTLSEWPEDSGDVYWHYLSERTAAAGPLFISSLSLAWML